jgi:hypothetical protein
MNTTQRQEPERFRDRRAALEAAKRAERVSPALAKSLFDTIARAGHPDLTDAQLDEAFAIYQSMTERGT